MLLFFLTKFHFFLKSKFGPFLRPQKPFFGHYRIEKIFFGQFQHSEYESARESATFLPLVEPLKKSRATGATVCEPKVGSLKTSILNIVGYVATCIIMTHV